MFQVACPDQPELLGELRTSGSGPAVLLAGGGAGTAFVDEGVTQEVAGAGFTVHSVAWRSTWLTGDAGPASAACCLATLAHTLSQADRICLGGLSGGSAAAAWAVTAHGLGPRLGALVLASGPPFTRLDHACLGDDPGWQAACPTLDDALPTCHEPPCTFGAFNRTFVDGTFAGTPCADEDASFRATFQATSVAPPGAALALPPTRLLLGTEDCSEAVPQALLFAVLAGIEPELVPGPHELLDDPAGAAAFVATLVESCGP